RRVRVLRRRLIAWRPWGLASALSASLLLALVIAACGGDDDDADSPSGDGGDGTETVEIGLLISQSGVAAASVRSAIDAVELAVMQINEERFTVGDKRYKFNLNIVDVKSYPNSAVAAATELFDDKGVKFV